jgi:nucleotide-binding universal stress UspA family protein
VTFAKSQKHDLVVIGSHGRTGFDKLLLGSVANGVSQKAKCPVLIVR